VEAFEALTETEYFEHNYQLIRPFMEYFEDTSIGRLATRRGRRPPLFPIKLWNCYNGTLDGLPKTNNSCEGWHTSFTSLLSSSHPSIWNFIDAIRKEQSMNEIRIEQYISGHPVPVGKKKYRDTASRIQTIVSQYADTDVFDYLRGVAHNFQLQADS
jgi:hypothetical protein